MADNYSLAELRRIVRAPNESLTSSEKLVRVALAEMFTHAAHECAVLEATALMRIELRKSTRQPFNEKVVCLGGGQAVIEAEFARREAGKSNG